MKRKILLSPLIIIVLIIIVGVGAAGAAILIGTTQQGETNTQSINLQKGLVGWWKFDGNAKDKTMYANNGTVTGATLTTDRKGQVDKAYSFDAASSQYIDAGSGSSLDITGNITVSVWAKFSVSQTNRPLVGKWGTDQAYVLSILAGSNDKINFSIRVSEVNKGATSSQTYNDGNWHHYVGVFNGVNVLLYVDGGAEAIVGDATTGPIDSPVSNSLTIGNYNNLPSGNQFSGSIDDVRVYNRALSATEITALYEEYDPGIVISDLQKGLVGNWDMNGNAKDKTLYANNGTVTGAVLANDRKGQAQKAYGFNGSSKIDLGDVTILNGATTASWSFWFKLNSVTAERAIIARELSTNPTRQFSVTISTSRELRFSAAGALLTYSGTNTMPLSTWTHVVVTYDGTQAAADRIKYYSNGSSLSYTVLNTVPTSLQTMTGVNLFIGHREANSLYFDGDLDDVRMYNRALSAAEVTALYQEYDPGIQVSDLQKGLVGNWDMNGNAKDKTLYANNGTVTEAILTTDRKGQSSKAYSFDGDDYINYGDILDGTFTGASKDFSVSLWFKTSSSTGDSTRWLIQYASSFSSQFAIGKEATTGNLKIEHNGNIFLGQTNGSSYNNGVWRHLVVTRDDTGNAVKIYVDNSLDVTLGDVTIGNASNFYIGAQVTSPASRYWVGDIDDVRIYNRALSATEVQQLYESY